MALRFSRKKQRAKLTLSSLPIGDTPVLFFLPQDTVHVLTNRVSKLLSPNMAERAQQMYHKILTFQRFLFEKTE
jgi:hypothetical protein